MRRLLSRSWWTLAMLFSGAACGGTGSQNSPVYAGKAEAILGTGLYDFLPMPSCGRVPIIHGIQGGYHVWGAVRLRYMAADKVNVQFTISDTSGVALSAPIKSTIDLDPLDSKGLVVSSIGSPSNAPACPDGGLQNDGGTPVPVPGGADGWLEQRGIFIFLPLATTDAGIVPKVDGVPITIRLDATDLDGRTASDQHTIVPYYNK